MLNSAQKENLKTKEIVGRQKDYVPGAFRINGFVSGVALGRVFYLWKLLAQ